MRGVGMHLATGHLPRLSHDHRLARALDVPERHAVAARKLPDADRSGTGEIERENGLVVLSWERYRHLRELRAGRHGDGDLVGVADGARTEGAPRNLLGESFLPCDTPEQPGCDGQPAYRPPHGS